KDLRGQRITATCYAGSAMGNTNQYGWESGGAVVPCQQVNANARFLMGPSFFTYRFAATPTVSLFDNALELHVLVDGAYGKWNFQGANSYGNNYGERCVCSVMRDAEVAYGAWWKSPYGNSSNYPADFWKLREVGFRYQLPGSIVSLIGANAGSLSVSG